MNAATEKRGQRSSLEVPRLPDSNVETSKESVRGPGQSSDDAARMDEEGDQRAEFVSGYQLGIVLSSLTIVVFLMMLDLAIIVTAIPRITSDFHSLPDVGWYGSAYLLANCSVQPLAGKLYTHLRTKSTFLVFLAIFEIGSLVCGVASSSNTLIVGRAVAGIGASGLTNGALTIIAACVPMTKRPAYLGIMISVSQIGTVLGPLIGGALTQYTTWRWCFYINLPIGGAAAVFLFLINIPDRKAQADAESTIKSTLKRLDLIGFALFAPAAIQLLLALQWGGNRYRWDSATVIGLFCGAFGTFCAFLMWQHRVGDAAMIPFPILRQRAVWSSSLVLLFFFGSLLTYSYYMPIYFQAVRNATPTMSGIYMLPSVLSQIIFATVSGVLVGKLGHYLPWSIASGILSAVGTGLLSTLDLNTSTGQWIGFQILAGAGRGMGIQMPVIAIQNTLSPAQVPIGMSVAVFSQTFGGALFLAFAQIAFSNGLTSYIPTYAPGVDPRTVIEAGATAVRQAVPKVTLEGVLRAYNQSINHDFYIAAAAAAATFVFCWGMGWKSIKKPKKVQEEG